MSNREEAAAGLYLHVPFCAAICPYCDFAVLRDDAALRARFVESLVAEISLHRGGGWRFDTVYLGGGTPSALSPEQLGRILLAVSEAFDLAPGWKLHLEANPEDVTADAVAAWQALGLHFLSLGVQSFHADELKFLGRRHSPEEAERATRRALEAGIPLVSLDLIYGLPDQAAERVERNVAKVTDLGVPHVSCYQLTVHEGTPFARFRERGRLSELPEHAQGDLFALTHDRLAAGGLPAYEVSNFARSAAHRSPHNQKYWQHRSYLGLGPSAHSYRGDARWWNHRDLRAWSAALGKGERPVAERERLDAAALALERLMLALRTTDGLDLEDFAAQHGRRLTETHAAEIDRLVAEGLIAIDGGRLFPTGSGLAVADSLAIALSD